MTERKYQCTKCNRVVLKGQRKHHAWKHHKTKEYSYIQSFSDEDSDQQPTIMRTTFRKARSSSEATPAGEQYDRLKNNVKGLWYSIQDYLLKAVFLIFIILNWIVGLIALLPSIIIVSLCLVILVLLYVYRGDIIYLIKSIGSFLKEYLYNPIVQLLYTLSNEINSKSSFETKPLFGLTPEYFMKQIKKKTEELANAIKTLKVKINDQSNNFKEEFFEQTLTKWSNYIAEKTGYFHNMEKVEEICTQLIKIIDNCIDSLSRRESLILNGDALYNHVTACGLHQIA